MRLIILLQTLILAGMVAGGGLARGQDSLDEGWRDPPVQARLRAYWWWLNGNVTQAAITKDLKWMKAIGIGGALVFDAGGATEGGHAPVPAGPLFGSPQWRALFTHALREAERLGLEIGLNLQSGWNLGGPLVTPDKATKLITWSQLRVQGPTRLSIVLPQPPTRQRFYRDTFLLAYRLKPGRLAEPSGLHSRPIQHLAEKSAFSDSAKARRIAHRCSKTSPPRRVKKTCSPKTCST